MNIVKTPQGPIELCPPDPAQLRALRALLPLGAMPYDKPVDGAKYGVVMKCGDQEAFAVKQQPVEVPAEDGGTCFMANSILIAMSLRVYLENGFAGLMMPCAYMRNKGAKGVEAGIAYFGVPDPKGKEALDFPHRDAFDNQRTRPEVPVSPCNSRRKLSSSSFGPANVESDFTDCLARFRRSIPDQTTFIEP